MKQDLIDAIQTRRMVEFDYNGKHRVVEPHVLGTLKESLDLQAYQTEGGSNSGGLDNWRRFHVSGIMNLRVLNRTFPGPRPTSGPHSSFDHIIAVVK